MANPNGAGMTAQQAGMYNAGMNGMPAAGHYSDMQTLMQNMEQLSGWLQQNREDFLHLQDGIERVERVHGRYPGHQANGDSSQPTADSSAPTITSLQRALDASNARCASLERAHAEHLKLQSLYEDTLTEATERIRDYVFQQNEYILSLHGHYTTLLQNSRKETMDAQMIHQGWQAGLGRLNEELKAAVKARAEEKDPYRRKIAGLKEENRVLREKVGWPEMEKSESDGEQEEADGGQRVERTREESVGSGFRGRGGLRGQAAASVAAAVNGGAGVGEVLKRDEREKVLESVMGPQHAAAK